MSINLDLYDDIVVPVNGSGTLDPNKIRLSVWTPTIDVVLKMMEDEGLEVSADIERAFWDERAQSRLVESLLIKIPLPAFYVDGTREDRLVALDGIQRLRALKRFMREGAFALQGLDYLKELEGRTFTELKRPLQRRLEESTVTIHRIEAGTSEAAKFNIMRRIQSGATPLSAQEIRAVMNPGAGTELLRVLGRHEGFLDEELILFFILGPDRERHEENLRDTLRHLNDDHDFREEQTRRFLHVFHLAKAALSSEVPKRAWRSRFLKFLFALERADPDMDSLIKEYLT